MIWKDIEGYEGLYQVSDEGCVRRNGKILKCNPYPNGYTFVALSKGGKVTNKMIHRLVAKAFIPNPNNLPCVNHKDANRMNNSVNNLEWCTHSYNTQYALIIGTVANQCRIIRSVIVKDSEHIMKFNSMSDCSCFFGFTKCWLGNYIKKHGNPCKYGRYEICVLERGECQVMNSLMFYDYE